MSNLRSVTARVPFFRYKTRQEITIDVEQADVLIGSGLVEITKPMPNDELIELRVNWQNYPIGTKLHMPVYIARRLISRNYAEKVSPRRSRKKIDG